jgi:hypothetical protein
VLRESEGDGRRMLGGGGRRDRRRYPPRYDTRLAAPRAEPAGTARREWQGLRRGERGEPGGAAFQQKEEADGRAAGRAWKPGLVAEKRHARCRQGIDRGPQAVTGECYVANWS